MLGLRLIRTRPLSHRKRKLRPSRAVLWGHGVRAVLNALNIACISCSHFLAHLDTHHEPMAGAIRWVYNAPHTDCAVTCLQHQEVALRNRASLRCRVYR